MSSNKANALFVYIQQSAIVVAETTHASPPFEVIKLNRYTYPEYAGTLSDYSLLKTLGLEKKGFRMAKFSLSDPRFFVFEHEAETTLKTKDPEYFPLLIKRELETDNDAIIYQVLESHNGNLYDAEKVTDKHFIVAGIEEDNIVAIQDNIVNTSLYPQKIELSTLHNIGLLRKYMENEGQMCIMMLEIYDSDSLITLIEGNEVHFRKISSGERLICEMIKAELSLKDYESARKLLYSNTFDLSDIAPVITGPLLKEVSAMAGQYEVKTGQSITKVFLPTLSSTQSWMAGLISNKLGSTALEFKIREVAELLNVSLSSDLELPKDETQMIPIIAQMTKF